VVRVWFAVETSLDLIGTNIGAELEELYLPQVVDTALVRRWRQSSGVLRTFTNKHWINCTTLLYCSPQAARSIYRLCKPEKTLLPSPIDSETPCRHAVSPVKVYNRSQIQINSTCPNDADITLTVQ